MHVEGVPQEASKLNCAPIVLYGILKHEHKKTVLHFTVQRNTEYSGSVKSKVMYYLPESSLRSHSSVFSGPPDPVLWTPSSAREPDLQPTHTGWR